MRDPWSASTESAQAMSAALASLHARTRPRAAKALSFHPRAAFADQRERQVRERSEVAAGPDRSPARNLGQDAAVETREQQLGQLGPSARVSAGERVRPHQHRAPNDLVGIGIADAAGMTAKEAQLELLCELGRDSSRDEASEPGRDAVRGLLVRERPLDNRPRGGHLLPGRIGQLHRRSFDCDRPDVVGGEVLTGDADRGRLRHRGASLDR